MDNEGRTYTLFALYGDGSTMLLDDLRDTCQTYPGASNTIDDIACSIEWLENMWHLFSWDANSLILYCELSPGLAFVLLSYAILSQKSLHGCYGERRSPPVLPIRLVDS